MTKSPRKNVPDVGIELRRGRLHAKRTRFRSSYRARCSFKVTILDAILDISRQSIYLYILHHPLPTICATLCLLCQQICNTYCHAVNSPDANNNIVCVIVADRSALPNQGGWTGEGGGRVGGGRVRGERGGEQGGGGGGGDNINYLVKSITENKIWMFVFLLILCRWQSLSLSCLFVCHFLCLYLSSLYLSLSY